MPMRLRTLLTTALVASALIPLHASSPKFFQAATQADFLKGDVENLSIDNHGQLTLGPVTELVYETSAPFLWSMVAAPDGTLFIGTGNEGKVFRVDPQGKGSMFFDSAELEAHALALAPERRPLRRHLARRQDLQGRSQRRLDHVLQRRRQVHLGAGGGRQGQRLRRHRRQRRHSQDHARRQRQRLLQDQHHPRDGARLRQERQPDRRHRHARQGAADRSRRQAVRAARLAVPGNPRAAVRRQGRALRRRAQRTAQLRRGPGGDRQRRRPGHRRRGRAGANRVGVRRDHVDVDRRHRRFGIAGHAARGSPVAQGRGLPHPARRRLGSVVGVARRLALRPDVRSQRRADHRHRRQGQALPTRRRSAAADPARPRRGAAGHGVLQGSGRPAVLRHGEPRQTVPGLA